MNTFAYPSIPSTMIKVAIVEDDIDVRAALREIIPVSGDIECVEVFPTGEAFLAGFDDLQADVVLMDITLPGISGIECVEQTKAKRPGLQYLMFTSHNDAERTFQSLCKGATGYLLKNSTPQQIFEGIRDIQNGGSPMSAEIARMVVASFSKQPENNQLLQSFSPREQEILLALSRGLSYKEIASELYISIETVRTYLRKIYETLQVHSKVEALNKVFPR
jgi:DNA-binding NarL/FixJ family response regulator